MAPRSSGPEIDAVVKWFNPQKGFGFAEMGDGSGDAFLHIRAVEAAGYRELEPGTRLTVRVSPAAQGSAGHPDHERRHQHGDAGRGWRWRWWWWWRPSGRSWRIGRLRPWSDGGRRTAPVALPERAARPRPGSGDRRHGQVGDNPAKGFGFIAAEDQGKDVFVHRSVLERAGIPDLQEGQRVQISVVQSQKGREATAIDLAD